MTTTQKQMEEEKAVIETIRQCLKILQRREAKKAELQKPTTRQYPIIRRVTK
jgi:hypothetical protein